ncbi:unnamed protein product, partial [Mesorhabditis spiculigera]
MLVAFFTLQRVSGKRTVCLDGNGLKVCAHGCEVIAAFDNCTQSLAYRNEGCAGATCYFYNLFWDESCKQTTSDLIAIYL